MRGREADDGEGPKGLGGVDEEVGEFNDMAEKTEGKEEVKDISRVSMGDAILLPELARVSMGEPVGEERRGAGRLLFLVL
jgi:hypothetical protein